jgi:hypothetical protein
VSVWELRSQGEMACILIEFWLGLNGCREGRTENFGNLNRFLE